jgi:ribosomal protein S27E
MKAQVSIAAFFVNCQKCNADIESPNGSLMWSVSEKAPEKIECTACQTVLTLPKQYAGLVA